MKKLGGTWQEWILMGLSVVMTVIIVILTVILLLARKNLVGA